MSQNYDRQDTILRVLGMGVEIRAIAAQHGLDPTLVAAVVAQESAGHALAERFEPQYRWLWGDDDSEKPFRKPALISKETEFNAQKTSRGPMQIMVATARWLGFADWPGKLFEPACGLAWGCKYLRWCLDRHEGNTVLGLLRYNGGARPEYAKEVLAWQRDFQEAMN